MQTNSKLIDYVDKHSIHIIHRSSNTCNSDIFAATVSVGKSIENLICICGALCMRDIDEANTSIMATSLKTHFRKIIINDFPQTKVYKNVDFGPGVTQDIVSSPAMILQISHYYLGAIFNDDVISNLTFFINCLQGIEYCEIRDPKTILQEYYQKNKLLLPVYRTEQVNDKQHEAIFEAEISLPDGARLSSNGESKKKAESNVAKEACIHLGLDKHHKKMTIALENIETLWEKLYGKQLAGKYVNNHLNMAFGLPNNFNSIQAFIHTRMKGKQRSIITQRKYATLGSFYINFLASLSHLELVRRGVSFTNKLILGVDVLSKKGFMAFYHSGFISKNSIPYKDHEDYLTQSYYVDCIQSLFGLSLLRTLHKKSKYSFKSLIHSLDAINWIDKRVVDASRTKVEFSRNMIPTLVLHRIQKYGFSIRLINDMGEYNLQISHIRNGNQFILRSTIPNTTRRDAMNHLSGVCLKALDREGANKRGNSSRLTQSFHFFMFEPIFSPVNALNQPI